MLLAFSVFRPCISVVHIVDAYRLCISSHHIGGAYRRIHHHQNQRTNEPPPPEPEPEPTNGNELTHPIAGPEMTARLRIAPEMTAHAPAHQIDPLTIPRHPDPLPEPSRHRPDSPGFDLAPLPVHNRPAKTRSCAESTESSPEPRSSILGGILNDWWQIPGVSILAWFRQPTGTNRAGADDGPDADHPGRC